MSTDEDNAKLNAQYAADRDRLRTVLLTAIHEAFADDEMAPDLETTINDNGGVEFTSKAAGWKFLIWFKHRVNRGSSYRYSLTGTAEASTSYLGRANNVRPIRFRKDGTADTQRLVDAMKRDLQNTYWAVKRSQRMKANEAVVERVTGGEHLPRASVCATTNVDKPVKVSFSRELTEEQAAKLLAFLKTEGL
jgi:hypothetical protein